MNSGFYLSKIKVLGTNKKKASISLDKGLNVISGASNTGKSYLFECIDFMLGSQTSPKPIKESEGYKQVRAEFKEYSNKIFTLNRQFDDKKIYLSETPIDEFEKSEPIQLSVRHDSSNENNLSVYLLKRLGLNGKKLKYNKFNHTRPLSFRELAKFCLVSEEKIITSESPIYTGQSTQETINKALFKLLLTGKDDDDLENIEDPKIVKSRIKGKIELINENIDKKEKKLEHIKNNVDKLNKDEINIQIEKLVNVLNKIQQNISDEEKKKNLIWEDVVKNKSKITQIDALLNRFKLLDEHYSSDLDRLEFMNEGKQYIDQLKKVNCPLCDSLIEKKVLEPYEDNNTKIFESIKTEYSKVKEKKQELSDTVKELTKEKVTISNELESKQKELKLIEETIINKLKPLHETNNKQLQDYFNFRNQKYEKDIISEEIITLKKELKYYEDKYKEKQIIAKEKVIPENIYKELSKEIKDIMNGLGIKSKEVYYNPSENDIEIDGEKRKNYGKGFRAICLSAFMLGVMLFCLKRNQKHPSFLVLDSPLTAYRKGDGEYTKEDEDFVEDVQNKFFEYISNLPKIKECQIIVIDNKDPPVKIKDKINYIHFSKNKNVNRYGFYPM